MEAYQAYYNTNEASQGNTAHVIQPRNATNVQTSELPYTSGSAEIRSQKTGGNATTNQSPPPLAEDGKGDKTKRDPSAAKGKDGKKTTAEGEGKDDAKVINNIMHIDQKGANINITNINNH